MRFLIAFVISLSSLTASADFDHDHSIFDHLLKDIVVSHGHQTDVDYQYLNQNPESLNRYVSAIESVSKDSFDNWNRNRKLAFLINAYNALTLKLIIDNYPGIDSILDLGGLVFSTPWDREFFTLFGKPATLAYIEHELIRKNFDEPRIHFAVNCASRGCPPLQSDAYVADRLDQQLEYATRLFLTDPDRNRYNPDTKKLELSSIFTWYKQDFVEAAGSVAEYVAPYITDDPEIRKQIESRASGIASINAIDYLDYDWDLNDTATR